MCSSFEMLQRLHAATKRSISVGSSAGAFELLTRFDTGQRCKVSSGAGFNSSMPASPPSQGSKSFLASNTGIRYAGHPKGRPRSGCSDDPLRSLTSRSLAKALRGNAPRGLAAPMLSRGMLPRNIECRLGAPWHSPLRPWWDQFPSCRRQQSGPVCATEFQK